MRRAGQWAVLREISGVFHETDTFWIVRQTPAGWRLLTTLDMVGNGRGVVGSHELRAFRSSQTIPGGEPELEAIVHADVGEMTACGTERRDEQRRTVCTHVDGGWVCRTWTLRAEPVRYVPHAEVERGCSAPPPVPGWSIELEFSADSVDVRTTQGTPPDRARVGRHELSEIFRRDD